MERPTRPPGHPPIPILQWQHYNILQMFGATNTKLLDGLCGARIVGIDSGDVAEDYAQCAAPGDLIVEGWGVRC